MSAGHFYIHSAKLDGIRGFHPAQAAEVVFQHEDGSYPGWTVIAGQNGAGKTTFLRAIVLAVTAKNGALPALSFARGWANSAAEESRLDIRTSEGPVAPLFFGANFPGFVSHQTESAHTSDQLFASYGAFRRLTGNEPNQDLPIELARHLTLFREDVGLVEATRWLERVNHHRLDGKEGYAELESRVVRLLSDGLLPGGAKAHQVDSDGLWIKSNEVILPLGEMSDGYRSTAALVVDIVRNVFEAHGRLDMEGAVIRNPGVVLIDEIDAHLHVSWQQRIGEWLTGHFPNIQFIVTTHSPFPCQAADKIIRLPTPGDLDDQPRCLQGEAFNRVVWGGPTEAVLTELFGLHRAHSWRSEEARREVAALEAMLMTGDELTDVDVVRLRSLRAKLPDTMVTDSDLVGREG